MSSAQLLHGAPVADAILADIARRVAGITPAPHLIGLLASDREESRVYLEQKRATAARVGLRFTIDVLSPGAWTTAAVRARVQEHGADPDVHGIIVQLPPADGIDIDAVLSAIPPEKDVDGLHPLNLGRSLLGMPALEPATAAAVMAILAHYEILIAGKRAVVVGRSRIVGRPTIGMLLRANATVTVCHRQTRDLAAETQRADILVAGAGSPHLITPTHVRPGAVVIDTGWTRVDGRTMGDVHPDVADVASAITPVPGGVGPVTVAQLLANLVTAYEWQRT